MKYRLGLLLISIIISSLTLGGCAALKKGRKVEESPEVRLEKILLERALEYERKNQPLRALQSYEAALAVLVAKKESCLLYTSTSPRDVEESRMPSSA